MFECQIVGDASKILFKHYADKITFFIKNK